MSQPRDHPLSRLHRPSWAWGHGDDRFGPFVDLKIAGVVQRMRWIPEGEFLMGSPESESGRFPAEGPRHQVTLSEGFWLADTPCTQELWQAVMHENPSEFVSPERPVENVSWEDCLQFFDTVESLQPGLGLRLPTEAQWERACRADTDYVTWMGDLEILGHRNAPLLDTIAWYGGNSGEGYDLEDGFDTSGWTEMQYPNAKAGTRLVKTKAPNPWGLFDMLGNVWEWCADRIEAAEEGGLPGYPPGPREDPVGDQGAVRVFRGGSWLVHARFTRAAYRGWLTPGLRDVFLGFRLSRGPGGRSPRLAPVEPRGARDEPA